MWLSPYIRDWIWHRLGSLESRQPFTTLNWQIKITEAPYNCKARKINKAKMKKGLQISICLNTYFIFKSGFFNLIYYKHIGKPLASQKLQTCYSLLLASCKWQHRNIRASIFVLNKINFVFLILKVLFTWYISIKKWLLFQKASLERAKKHLIQELSTLYTIQIIYQSRNLNVLLCNKIYL